MGVSDSDPMATSDPIPMAASDPPTRESSVKQGGKVVD